MWKPPSRLLGDKLDTPPEKKSVVGEKVENDYYKITEYILHNLEMHPDYEPPMTVTQTCLERLRVTYRVNIYTVDRKRVRKIWKSYWVEIKEGVMSFNPEITKSK